MNKLTCTVNHISFHDHNSWCETALCDCSAASLAQNCDGLLVVGSSLQVYSAFRLAKAAKQAEASLTLLTAGWTRADDLADMKIECLAGEALSRLAKDPALLVPRSYEVATA